MKREDVNTKDWSLRDEIYLDGLFTQLLVWEGIYSARILGAKQDGTSHEASVAYNNIAVAINDLIVKNDLTS